MSQFGSGTTSPEYIELPKTKQKKKGFIQLIEERRMLKFNYKKSILSSNFIPNSRGQILDNSGSRIYSGQFSYDGSKFYCSLKDFKILIYDAQDPNNLNLINIIYGGPIGQWTITDSTLSIDNSLLAYSSITPVVYLSNLIHQDMDTSIDFSLVSNIEHNSREEYNQEFGIWSIKLTQDKQELAVGTSENSIKIMNLETKKLIVNETKHDDDVNTISFMDDSNHVLLSGSDDSFIKLWDRRLMTSNSKSCPVGLFLGHLEGVTCVSSKGDGRYFCSNSKDQSCKLWDIRKMIIQNSLIEEQINRLDCGPLINFDYRFMNYPQSMEQRTHPMDNSITTFRGHKVLKTLIRCYFSPLETTGQKYIYSGSSDGLIHIYDIQKPQNPTQFLNSKLAKQISIDDIKFDPNEVVFEEEPSINSFSSLISMIYGEENPYSSSLVVRDISWHPTYPVIMASCWKGRSGQLVKHQFTYN